jgi:hypothetical protein
MKSNQDSTSTQSSADMIAEGSPVLSVGAKVVDAKVAENTNTLPTPSDWNEHEHVSLQVQLEAEKLVQMVGTPELAKQAISVVEHRQLLSSMEGTDVSTSQEKDHASAVKVSEFQKALANFETSLATPVVSGELTEWATNALKACEEVRRILLGDMQQIHAEQFTSILRDSVDLASQVEKLRAADTHISNLDCNDVVSDLRLLLSLARSVRQDEAKLTSLMADVVKRGMDFVVAARSQETSIVTWLSEAVNRDLGSGD